MIISGTPALFKVGVPEILFGTVWKPTGNPASFGILYVILTSIVGTFLAILIGVPIGLFTAIFLAEVAPPKVAAVVRPAVELLAGIPAARTAPSPVLFFPTRAFFHLTVSHLNRGLLTVFPSFSPVSLFTVHYQKTLPGSIPPQRSLLLISFNFKISRIVLINQRNVSLSESEVHPYHISMRTVR